MPCTYITCEQCGAGSSQNLLIGLFWYRLPDGRLAPLSRTMGWCHHCMSFAPVEEIPALEELNLKCRRLRLLLRWWNPEAILKLSEKWPELRRYLFDQEALNAREWRKMRQDPPRCLECGSTSITAIGWGSSRHKQTHPGCGGRLTLRTDEDIWFYHLHRVFYYDAEGHFLEETVEYPT